MKQIIKSPSDITRLEYWMATAIFIVAVFMLVSTSIDNYGWTTGQFRFDEAHQEFSRFSNYFFPSLIRCVVFFASYLFLTFIVIPQIVAKRRIALGVILVLPAFAILWLTHATTETWLSGYRFSESSEDDLYHSIFADSAIYVFWLLIMFALYNTIKFLAIYLLENTELIQSKYRVISRDGIYAFIVWMIGLFVMLMAGMPAVGIAAISICSLSSIVVYCYSIYAILPEVYREGKSFKLFLRRATVPVVLLSFAIFLFLLVSVPKHNNEEIAISIAFFNCAILYLFTIPLSWYIYKHRLKVDYEIRDLQTALGKSTADLTFLRSQINPHFLFNILNTLYGLSLQENAEKTSEGIQKLGDMMRFMLRENLQEKISLTREIEYLHNYIGLQSLRTQSSPDIKISIEIEDYMGGAQIAPMLLIPFVENAFKHGISLKEPSYIRISLNINEDILYFDVSNSRHPKSSVDPEKDNNGIGLNNVKQRLRLMYAHRNELSIRETNKEFFVHLTLKLG